MKRTTSIAILVIVLAGCGNQGGTSDAAERPAASLKPDGAPTFDGTVTLKWQRPDRRENGDYLEGDEIAGYEVRFKTVDVSEYETLVIEDGWVETYELDQLQGRYRFEIAAIDRQGVYSDFVELQAY